MNETRMPGMKKEWTKLQSERQKERKQTRQKRNKGRDIFVSYCGCQGYFSVLRTGGWLPVFRRRKVSASSG
jgi:hypothetical protein